MTDSMNFGPDWIRNLSSEGSTGGGTSGGTRYQLAEYRYGREEMLALFDRNLKPPASITNFKCLYSDTSLLPLALIQTSDEERAWQGRPMTQSGPPRGRGGSLERGGRVGRGRGYQYGRPTGYEVGWGNGEQLDWSPRKEYGNQRTMSVDNWRRSRMNEEDEGWRNVNQGRTGAHEKWVRSSSWRSDGDTEDRPPERGTRTSWSDNRPMPSRKSWENEDHLPEWATEYPTEGGGTFDEKGAFHGSDDEQADSNPPTKRETGLQKSNSQQHISKKQVPPLSTSKSTTSLNKPEDSSKKREDPTSEVGENSHSTANRSFTEERKKSIPNVPQKVERKVFVQDSAMSEGPSSDEKSSVPNGPVAEIIRPEVSDFERLQEDFVLKLVVDEELPKQTVNNLDMGIIQPPPNLNLPPIQDKWFYQDPQGQMQGPFSNLEMAEWYKAGYFSNQLKVRRYSDERFFLLGELITICGGVNPFQSGIRYPVLKNDVTKMPDPDLLQFQYLSQMAAYKQAQERISAEPWSAITLQQQELAAQRLIMQQQQVSQDLQYLQHSQATNPLMHMISQMQQANKLPGQGLVDKQSQNIPGSLDPHIQLHMNNMLSLQNRIPLAGMANLPAGFTNHSVALPTETPSPDMPNIQNSTPLNASNIPLSGIQNNIPVSIGGNINIPLHTPHGSVDQISSNQNTDPISSLLKQLQQQSQQSQQVDSLWQQNPFPSNTPQWQTQNEVPLSMWDIPTIEKMQKVPSPTEKIQLPQPKPPQIEKEKEKEQQSKDESSAKDLKKKKEQEEKQAKKEADEKRKQEQKKQEIERKVAEEKRKREEERIKRELEKAKREAEEKRMRDLEEKRRLKEQRKAEEEARKKMEEQKKLEEERLREEMKEKETRRQEEERRLQAEQIRIAKAAPWSRSNSNQGMSLTDIQKAEKEKRAIDAALQMQRLQEEKEQHQNQQEKSVSAGIQLSWAKKPVEPRKVKSLAEIQAEEQGKLAKQIAESRLQKEKEPPVVVTNTSSNIWNGQNLTWSATNSQWPSNSGGFWDDSSNKQIASKPSTVSKSNSTNTLSTPPKQQSQTQKQQTKSNKIKKDESKANHNNNNNGPPVDEFTNWCYNTLSNISTDIDIPTFVTFLRDIESAYEVREYCKDYLGESNATQQFASNFLEKRRSFKPKNNAHKDDMCSPAPAITPSLQHSTEFQEVKGKNKKIKKSKMLKVDSRILGFNVTSAPDRINVGDRDYGDNS